MESSALRVAFALLPVLCAASSLSAQTKVVEIPQMTVPHSVIDMDKVGPAGPVTIGQVNRAGSGKGGSLAELLFTPSTAAQGVYNTNATLGRALARTTGGGCDLILVDPSGAFGAFNARIELAVPSLEFGIAIADWVSTMILDFYLAGNPMLTGFTTSTYGSAATKYFQMSNGLFDRVDVRASTTGGNWCIPEIVTQVPVEYYTPFGKGCPGTDGTPRLAPLSGIEPRAGALFQAAIGGMPLAGGVVFAALGTSETAYTPLSLPFDLGPVGAAGCRIWCAYTLLTPLPNIGGSATYNFFIPASPALVGARFYNQVLVPDAKANALGLTVSNGARGVVR